ncbi:MAG: sulfur carrier protein ThiS [Lachnospiraceae bacterium]|nr:sulfur carrier protein ThiS [Lachnospiraceae bacterium]
MRVNNEKMTLNRAITVLELLLLKGYPIRQTAVEVNGAIVPNAKYRTYGLHNEDNVEIVRFAGGGLSN